MMATNAWTCQKSWNDAVIATTTAWISKVSMASPALPEAARSVSQPFLLYSELADSELQSHVHQATNWLSIAMCADLESQNAIEADYPFTISHARLSLCFSYQGYKSFRSVSHQP
jgi:hypothetical protein